MLALSQYAKGYAGIRTGSFAYSPAHTNYQDNERILHKYFAALRGDGSELFAINFEQLLEQMPRLDFKDDTEQKQKHCDSFMESMKGFVLYGETLHG
jgi:hypothetical protein